MADKPQSELEQTKRIMERLVKTPPMPHTPARDPLPKGDFFAVLGHRMRVVGGARQNEDGSMTGALYRNLDDYRAGRVMEPEFRFWR